MEPVFARTRFSQPIYEKAARTLVETGGGVFSHTVGMAVHDVGSYAGAALKPGQVFSVDPQLRVPEENLYLRYEDTIVVTESGYENFTDFCRWSSTTWNGWYSRRVSCRRCRPHRWGQSPSLVLDLISDAGDHEAVRSSTPTSIQEVHACPAPAARSSPPLRAWL